MDRAFLEQLGLDVTEDDGVVEAELQLTSASAINPLTRKVIDRVTFTVMGDRLLYVSPPEFVGAQPINVAFLTQATRLEDLVTQTLSDHLFQLERRSNELTRLGISPKVDPQTLQLSAELERPPLKFLLGMSRAGQFRIVRTLNDGAELSAGGSSQVFELSEFLDRRALEDFLFALFADVVQAPPAPKHPTPVPPSFSSPSVIAGQEPGLSFQRLAAAFGDAHLPSRAALDLVADLSINGELHRFAASRVQGQEFRGLLAGPSGKVWAGRFELIVFPGIRPFVADLLQVPIEAVEVVTA